MITTIDVDPGATCAGPIPPGKDITAVRYAGQRRMISVAYMPKADFDGCFASTREVRAIPTYWTEGVEAVELNYAAPCVLRLEVETADEGEAGDGGL